MFVAGLILTALLILIGHWFPWPVKLHRLAAYTYGCGCILAGAAVPLLSTGRRAELAGLALLMAVAGAATGLGHLIDAALRNWVQAQVRDERQTE